MVTAYLTYRRFLGLMALILCSSRFTQTFAQQENVSTEFETLANAAAAARERNNIPEAIRDYREALKLQPDWQEGLWNSGVLEYESDHYAEAIPLFRQLTQLAPGGAPAWNFLGLCEYEVKDYASALQHLTKGQELGGADDGEILRVVEYHLALLLIREGNFDAAIAKLHALSASGQSGTRIKTAFGLAELRVRLLPEEVDPSKDALLQDVGDGALLLTQGETAAGLQSLANSSQKYAETPYVHLAYGSALFTAGKYEQASAECRKEIGLSPESFVAHELLGKILQKMGGDEKARQEFTVAKKLQPQESGVEERAAQRYANRAGTTNAGKSLLGAPHDADWALAMSSYSAHQYREAIAALKRWVEQTPNVGTAWAVMGLSEFELADYDNASIHLQRGQQLGIGGNADGVQLAKYRLAILLNRSKQFDSAEAVLMSVGDNGPLGGEARFALGMSLLRMAKLPADVASDEKALVTGAGEIGELLTESKYDQAFPKFEALIKEYPSRPFLHYFYGTALAALSRYDDAEEQFRQEIARTPGSELPYVQIASIALKRRDAGKALTLAQQAVRLASREAEPHYLLGRSYLELGKDKEAVEELETAGKIAPASAQIHFNLAKAYAKGNQPDKAAEERAIFSHLNELLEQQRSMQGTQSYGAHNATGAVFSPAEGKDGGSPDR
jgi:tetratricopeptide (TPR) repeat protein